MSHIQYKHFLLSQGQDRTFQQPVALFQTQLVHTSMSGKGSGCTDKKLVLSRVYQEALQTPRVPVYPFSQSLLLKYCLIFFVPTTLILSLFKSVNQQFGINHAPESKDGCRLLPSLPLSPSLPSLFLCLPHPHGILWPCVTSVRSPNLQKRRPRTLLTGRSCYRSLNSMIFVCQRNDTQQ